MIKHMTKYIQLVKVENLKNTCHLKRTREREKSEQLAESKDIDEIFVCYL